MCLEGEHETAEPGTVNGGSGLHNLANGAVSIGRRVCKIPAEGIRLRIGRLWNLSAIEKHLCAGTDGRKHSLDQHLVGCRLREGLGPDLDVSGGNENKSSLIHKPMLLP
jgi:hypothetical protein